LLDFEILDYHIGEQLTAHGFEVGLGNAGFMVDFDQTTRTHIIDPVKPEPFESMMDRLAQRVENTIFQRNKNTGFHSSSDSLALGIPIEAATAETRGQGHG
jgi:hypothetical protein